MCEALGNVVALILVCDAFPSSNLTGASPPMHNLSSRHAWKTSLRLPMAWGSSEVTAPSSSPSGCPQGCEEYQEGLCLSREMGWFVLLHPLCSPPAAAIWDSQVPFRTSIYHLGPPGLVMAVPLDTILRMRVRRQQCLTSAALSCREIKLCLSTILVEP